MPIKPLLAVPIAVTCLGGAAAGSALAGTGGASSPGAPRIERVSCLSEPELPCAASRGLYRSRSFVLRGRGLATAAKVIFRGRRTRRDDTAASVVRRRDSYAVATVPRWAKSGALTLVDRYGGRVPVRRVRVRRASRLRPLDITPGSRFFFAAQRKPSFSFQVSRALTAGVELVSQETGTVVRRWDVPATPGQPATVQWDGRGTTGVEGAGSYEFRLTGQAATSAQASDSNEPSFFFADHLFPIRGRHNFGYSDTNNFGGGRGHKGQDMFARCGTPLAAARGGRVEHAGYQSRAGNYVVIDGAETGVDYLYMHMRRPPLVQAGQQVFTGQKIGEVGETGRASGCHLHFEMWSSPGWYQGGSAFDPLPSLRSWDRYS